MLESYDENLVQKYTVTLERRDDENMITVVEEELPVIE